MVVLFSAVFDAYKKISGSDIEDSIKGETTGNLENLLVAVGKTCSLSVDFSAGKSLQIQQKITVNVSLS